MPEELNPCLLKSGLGNCCNPPDCYYFHNFNGFRSTAVPLGFRKYFDVADPDNTPIQPAGAENEMPHYSRLGSRYLTLSFTYKKRQFLPGINVLGSNTWHEVKDASGAVVVPGGIDALQELCKKQAAMPNYQAGDGTMCSYPQCCIAAVAGENPKNTDSGCWTCGRYTGGKTYAAAGLYCYEPADKGYAANLCVTPLHSDGERIFCNYCFSNGTTGERTSDFALTEDTREYRVVYSINKWTGEVTVNYLGSMPKEIGSIMLTTLPPENPKGQEIALLDPRGGTNLSKLIVLADNSTNYSVVFYSPSIVAEIRRPVPSTPFYPSCFDLGSARYTQDVDGEILLAENIYDVKFSDEYSESQYIQDCKTLWESDAWEALRNARKSTGLSKITKLFFSYDSNGNIVSHITADLKKDAVYYPPYSFVYPENDKESSQIGYAGMSMPTLTRYLRLLERLPEKHLVAGYSFLTKYSEEHGHDILFVREKQSVGISTWPCINKKDIYNADGSTAYKKYGRFYIPGFKVEDSATYMRRFEAKTDLWVEIWPSICEERWKAVGQTKFPGASYSLTVDSNTAAAGRHFDTWPLLFHNALIEMYGASAFATEKNLLCDPNFEELEDKPLNCTGENNPKVEDDHGHSCCAENRDTLELPPRYGFGIYAKGNDACNQKNFNLTERAILPKGKFRGVHGDYDAQGRCVASSLNSFYYFQHRAQACNAKWLTWNNYPVSPDKIYNYEKSDISPDRQFVCVSYFSDFSVGGIGDSKFGRRTHIYGIGNSFGCTPAVLDVDAWIKKDVNDDIYQNRWWHYADAPSSTVSTFSSDILSKLTTAFWLELSRSYLQEAYVQALNNPGGAFYLDPFESNDVNIYSGLAVDVPYMTDTEKVASQLGVLNAGDPRRVDRVEAVNYICNDVVFIGRRVIAEVLTKTDQKPTRTYSFPYREDHYAGLKIKKYTVAAATTSDVLTTGTSTNLTVPTDKRLFVDMWNIPWSDTVGQGQLWALTQLA